MRSNHIFGSIITWSPHESLNARSRQDSQRRQQIWSKSTALRFLLVLWWLDRVCSRKMLYQEASPVHLNLAACSASPCRTKRILCSPEIATTPLRIVSATICLTSLLTYSCCVMHALTIMAVAYLGCCPNFKTPCGAGRFVDVSGSICPYT